MDDKEKLTLDLISVMKQFGQHKHYFPKDQCLSPAQLRFMHVLWGETTKHPEGVKVSHMSKALNVTSSSITQLINSLEEKDFIAKKVNEKDRRALYVTLSKAGDEFLKSHQEHLLEHVKDLVHHIGLERMQSFVETLKDITEYMTEERSRKI